MPLGDCVEDGVDVVVGETVGVLDWLGVGLGVALSLGVADRVCDCVELRVCVGVGEQSRLRAAR